MYMPHCGLQIHNIGEQLHLTFVNINLPEGIAHTGFPRSRFCVSWPQTKFFRQNQLPFCKMKVMI